MLVRTRDAQALLLDGPGAPPTSSGLRYKALVARLFSRARFGSKLGLDAIQGVLDALGNPEQDYRTVHVAGSNGKGSTSSFLAAILSARQPVGLYTSPHLISMTERVQLVSQRRYAEASQAELLAAADRLLSVAPDFGPLTFFEILTVLGLLLFSRRQVDIAVIEAGLGARLDATRVVDPELAVLTDLSLEHTSILGPTLTEIAAEEGAVMRPGRPLVMADGPAEAMAQLDKMVQATGAIPYRLGRDFFVRRAAQGRGVEALGERYDLELRGQDGLRKLEGLRLSLLGPHQARNAALAAQAACLAEPSLPDSALVEGLEGAHWPGRIELFERPGHPSVLLDGAQNAHAAQALAAALVELRSQGRVSGPLHVLFGVLDDKDADLMTAALAPLAASFTVTRPPSPRARDPEEVAALIPGAEVVEPVDAALFEVEARAQREGGWVVACGSLYLIGALRGLLG